MVVRNPTRRQQGLTIVDALIALCLIGVMIGIVIPKYQRVARAAQESAVKAELANIRSSIELFRILNKRNPASLGELIEKKVMLPGRIGGDEYSKSFYDQQYLMAYALDQKGNILDAFGNPFLYDPVRGEVRTTTRGYENW
jgi:Tfp pilus assembly protein PilE